MFRRNILSTLNKKFNNHFKLTEEIFVMKYKVLDINAILKLQNFVTQYEHCKRND